MPWQQCSIFATHGDRDAVGSTKERGEAREGRLTRGNEAAGSRPSESDAPYVHEVFKMGALPRWNASVYVRALQNAAYLQNGEQGETQRVRGIAKSLVKAVAQNINEVNNYELTRVIFACSKGRLLQREVVTQSFLTLMENEVMQRLELLHAIDLFRILHSVTHINAEAEGCPAEALHGEGASKGTPFDRNMVKCVVHRVMDKIANLGAMDIANLTCLIAYNGIGEEKIERKLNGAVKRRLWGIKDPIKVLTPVIALAMFNVLSRETAEFGDAAEIWRKGPDGAGKLAADTRGQQPAVPAEAAGNHPAYGLPGDVPRYGRRRPGVHGANTAGNAGVGGCWRLGLCARRRGAGAGERVGEGRRGAKPSGARVWAVRAHGVRPGAQGGGGKGNAVAGRALVAEVLRQALPRNEEATPPTARVQSGDGGLAAPTKISSRVHSSQGGHM
ncbi:isoleucyl-tRNA synthetase, putative [Babesia caballi]|uniref:Isoleucyl-tRNA synthetase, putative n=1 Tax=Babesia caballi TaxID=5871 RepID=A0AAV4LUH0_BABCB|nr:isoleucyl-tRNA synthetase, putative [Babesia caballi]